MESAWGTGWITVGCTANIWKDCWATALAIPYLYESVIFTNCNKFCLPLHLFSHWQCEVQKKISKEFNMKNTNKKKARMELSSNPELDEERNNLLVQEMTDGLQNYPMWMVLMSVCVCVCKCMYALYLCLSTCI